jgi:hypothetical protein
MGSVESERPFHWRPLRHNAPSPKGDQSLLAGKAIPLYNQTEEKAIKSFKAVKM